MIYVTGDCHGDYRKFNTRNFPDQKEMTKDDYVVICGDFGYWDESKEMEYWLDWLESKPFTVLWVDGNHENYDLIKKLPVERWKGGKVQRVRPHVIHLMRGQVYDIDGYKIFTFGGARCHDIDGGILEPDDPELNVKIWMLNRNRESFRINHVSWWKEEMPSAGEMLEGLENLERVDKKVDFIFTHCCASDLQAVRGWGLYKSDELTDYFMQLRELVDYKKWCFGHYHMNTPFTPKDICLYEDIVRLV